MNARTFAASFFPGADSTPLETSTANGRNFLHRVRDIFRRQAAGEKNRFAEFLRLNRQIPVEFFAGAAKAALGIRIQQKGVGVKILQWFQAIPRRARAIAFTLIKPNCVQKSEVSSP